MSVNGESVIDKRKTKEVFDIRGFNLILNCLTKFTFEQKRAFTEDLILITTINLLVASSSGTFLNLLNKKRHRSGLRKKFCWEFFFN